MFNSNFIGITKNDDSNLENKSIVSNQFTAPLSTDLNKGGFSIKDGVQTLLIGILIFSVIISLSIAGYSFFLKDSINKNKNSISDLDKSDALFEFKSQLENMLTDSDRLKIFNSIYEKHLYISGMALPILESLVESDSRSFVYFSRFHLKKEDKSHISKVSLGGIALDYETLYRQINRFKTGPYTKYISSFKLSNLSLDEDGKVIFSVTFDLDISNKVFKEFKENKLNNIVQENLKNNVSRGPLYKNQISVPSVNINKELELTQATSSDLKQKATSSAEVSPSTLKKQNTP